MSDQENPSKQTGASRPALPELREAAKPTPLQNFRNYFGFGFAGNTATAIVITNAVKKLFPKGLDKWSQTYEKKYIARKEEELLKPYEGKLDEAAQQVIKDKIASDAKEYGHKTVESRLLSVGGFLMLPLQSAADVSDYSKNMKGIVEPYATEHGMDALKQEIGKQMDAAVKAKDTKTQDVLANALEKPKFSPLGPSASKGLPKWTVGRVVALGSAFTVQKFVDDRLGKQKTAMDTTIARIITRISGGAKKHTSPEGEGAFNQAEAKPVTGEVPEGVDPKILNTVRMITTDAYMTGVAIAAQKFSVDAWDNKLPSAKLKINALRDRFTSGNQRSA